MKYKVLCTAIAATGLLLSCSTDSTIDNGDLEKPTPSNPSEDNSLYMSVEIALPSVLDSRADGSLSGYNNGDQDEYAVNNVSLILFEGTTESEATYLKTIQLTAPELSVSGTPTDITGNMKLSFQLTDITIDDGNKTVNSGNNLYGLIIVNKGDDSLYGTLTKATTKLSDWNAIAITSTGGSSADAMVPTISGTKYYTMTNMPQLVGETVQTLVSLDVSKLAKSPSDATSSAGIFYVQRGIAKVKIGASNSGSLSDISVKGTAGDKVTITNWVLDNTNKSTFAIQNVSGYSDWTGDHFTVNAADANSYTRIWWAIDPNYLDTDTHEDSYNSLVQADQNKVTNSLEAVEYCLENTMNYDQMLKSNITRVIFKSTYVLKDESSATDFVVFPGTDKRIKVESSDLKDSSKPTAGLIALKELIKTDESNATTTLEKYRVALGMANFDQKVMWYPGGETYYVAYIRHFDENETPIGNFTATNSYDTSHLGRYGVLRNNIYEVLVNSVSGYGLPYIPPCDGQPVDKEEEVKYNAIVDVNIVPWGTRKYDYDLK